MSAHHSIGDVARIAGVSVRTLHHYDAIGLLAPSGRSGAGYRLYTDRDLERLQEILFFRELGFALEDVGTMLRDPKLDRRKALEAQRALLVEKRERLGEVIALVDASLKAIEEGRPMTHDAMFKGFDHRPYEEEAKQRWGHTEQYAVMTERTKSYGEKEWTAIKAEGKAYALAFAAALDAGKSPRDPEVMDIAETARLHIDRWFYPCPKSMHAALGRMYVDDPRFAAKYESVRPGLAQFVAEALAANGER